MRTSLRTKLNAYLKGAMWFCTIILIMTTMFSIAYFITGWIYQAVGFTPAPLVVQIINSLAGIFLTGFSIWLFSRVFRSKIEAQQLQFWTPIFEALGKMAKGDFNVRVDKLPNENGPDRGLFAELVNSVNRTAEELNQMEKMRQEFISNVSHEIQSPLTSIRGFAGALKNDHLSADERHHYLDIIEMESTRLSRITENLLKLASLEAKEVRFEPKPYRLDRQIRTLVLACEPQWSGKQIEMDVALDEVEVTADEDLMSQVWINLISNSIKFTPEGGRICMQLCRQNNAIGFQISDNGVGIPAEDQARVFERFYKADQSRTHARNGGSGLGLSIAQKIVEMHHGTIGVESQPGSGATFKVSLPAEMETPKLPV